MQKKMTAGLIALTGFLLLWGIFRQIKPSAQSADGSVNQLFEEESAEKDFIKWVDFNVCYQALDDAYRYDIDTHDSATALHWIELLAFLAAKNGGSFDSYRSSQMDALAESLLSGEETIEGLAEGLTYYDYYLEAYSAVLGGMVGEYDIAVAGTDTASSPDDANGINDTDSYDDTDGSGQTTITWEHRYGLKCFLPIAKNFPYSDYDDFGVSRSYGYARKHLGHDMMGQVGTPIIAVESGYVEAIGWNQYGGWRLGIRSFDGKRYYYYAHLRKNFPYNKELAVGSVVTAGDVIGYMGRTGYSSKENTNNIDTPHLHFGLQLIFDESQKEGNGEIWIDCYDLIRFLYRNRSETVKDTKTKEWHRVTEMIDPAVVAYQEAHTGDAR